MAFGEDVATLLQSAGVGTLGTTLFVGTLPEAPDAAVAVLATGGAGPQYTISGTAYSVERAQVVVRATSYNAAQTTAAAAYSACLAWRNGVQNGTRYLSFTVLQNPFLLGLDDIMRPRFVFNVEGMKEG